MAESVLHKQLVLGELLDLTSFTNVCRTFVDLYKVGPSTLGRASYEPVWRWSEHVGPVTGESSCRVEHVGPLRRRRVDLRLGLRRRKGHQAFSTLYAPPPRPGMNLNAERRMQN